MYILRALLALISICSAAALIVALIAAPAGTDLGTLWHAAAPESLNLTQAVTQRYLHPVVWTHVLLPVLLMPASTVFTTGTLIALSLWLAVWLLARWRRKTTR